MRRLLVVLSVVLLSIVLAACTNNDTEKSEIVLQMDEVQEVGAEEYVEIMDKKRRLWREHATSVDYASMSSYDVKKCGEDIMWLYDECNDFIKASDFDLDIADELEEYYIELREEETVDDALGEIRAAIDRTFEEEWEVEVYQEYTQVLVVGAIQHYSKED